MGRCREDRYPMSRVCEIIITAVAEMETRGDTKNKYLATHIGRPPVERGGNLVEQKKWANHKHRYRII